MRYAYDTEERYPAVSSTVVLCSLGLRPLLTCFSAIFPLQSYYLDPHNPPNHPLLVFSTVVATFAAAWSRGPPWTG